METVSKILKAIGWIILGIGLIIIAIGVMFDVYVIVPTSLCLTTATVSMLIGMIIEEFA